MLNASLNKTFPSFSGNWTNVKCAFGYNTGRQKGTEVGRGVGGYVDTNVDVEIGKKKR